MDWIYLTVYVVCVGSFFYLFYTLSKPEKF